MKINPNKYYSLRQIFKLEIFTWIKSFTTLRRLVRRDIEKDTNLFKAIIVGQGRGTRYKIKGQILIDVLEKIEKEGLTINGK